MFLRVLVPLRPCALSGSRVEDSKCVHCFDENLPVISSINYLLSSGQASSHQAQVLLVAAEVILFDSVHPTSFEMEASELPKSILLLALTAPN